MRLVITGAGGFIGRNLSVALSERSDIAIIPAAHDLADAEFARTIGMADAVVHLAGVNRPKDPSEFTRGNADFTRRLIGALRQSSRKIPVAFASSIQAERDTPYGVSKRIAEELLFAHGKEYGSRIRVYRLPNVFGKWCRPEYNSVVATFCHMLARNLPIEVHDPSLELQLVYVDDVVFELLRFVDDKTSVSGFSDIRPVYSITVGELAKQIAAFRNVRSNLITERVGQGLVRALYSTYVSYLPPDRFSYHVPKYGDARGVFVEMLKTKDSGQISFFTAAPGVVRGGHFHHSKAEKFMVVKGKALFRFRQILTNETFEIAVNASEPMIVDTVPGWAHEVVNCGDDELIVMLWANEAFDRQCPDTYAHQV